MWTVNSSGLLSKAMLELEALYIDLEQCTGAKGLSKEWRTINKQLASQVLTMDPANSLPVLNTITKHMFDYPWEHIYEDERIDACDTEDFAKNIRSLKQNVIQLINKVQGELQ